MADDAVPKREGGLPGGVERGLLDDAFPYVRVPGDEGLLIILPGINDALQPVHTMPRFWARFRRGLGAGHTLVVLGRRRGLVRGITTGGLAEDYAGVIGRHFGAADLLGLSMGGMIAQHLAADHAGLVRRLVLAVCGARPDAAKMQIYAQWRAWAECGKWREAYADMIARTYANCPTLCAASWMRTSPRAVQRRAVDPGDFVACLDACMAHDARGVLGQIQARTLVLGGDDDALLDAALLGELAGQVRESRCHVVAGAGHAVFEQRPAETAECVGRFLAGQ